MARGSQRRDDLSPTYIITLLMCSITCFRCTWIYDGATVCHGTDVLVIESCHPTGNDSEVMLTYAAWLINRLTPRRINIVKLERCCTPICVRSKL